VKVKSLAAEAKIIRKEEKRSKLNSIREGLYRHRIDVVRCEARHAQLAYGFLRGIDYRKIEPKAKNLPNWQKVRKMIEKYGSHYAPWSCNVEKTLTAFETRREEAKKHLAENLKRFDEWILQAQATTK
jgi:hypothetical protein